MAIHGLGNVPQIGGQTDAQAIQTGANVATDAAAQAHKAGQAQLNDAIENFRPTDSITPGQSMDVGETAGFSEPSAYMRDASASSPQFSQVADNLNDQNFDFNNHINRLQEMAQTNVSDLVPATDTTGGGSSSTGGIKGLEDAYEKNLSSIDDLMNQLQNLDPSSPDYQKNLFQIQTKMQNFQSMQQMIAQIIQGINQMIQQMLQTLRIN